MTTTRRSEKGFTLISVMIALVMLTIGLLALAKVQTTLARTQSNSTLRGAALTVARSYTEEIRSRDPWTLASEGAVKVNMYGQVDPSGVLTRSVAVTLDADNLVRVTVQVDYPGQKVPVQLITMAYRG
jgi:type IV pilus assembly protein PilV